MPWRRRSAPSSSRAPRTEGGPATSPAWGTEARPSSRASVNTGSYGSGGKLGLEAAEADADDAAIAVRGGVAHDLLGLVQREAADDVGSQAHLDPVQLAGLLRRRRSTPLKISSQPTPRRTRSPGEKIPSR